MLKTRPMILAEVVRHQNLGHRKTRHKGMVDNFEATLVAHELYERQKVNYTDRKFKLTPAQHSHWAKMTHTTIK